MINYINKSVFNSGCDGLVNTVNCVGVMGAGLALEFGLRYPEMEKEYRKDCMMKKVKIGEIITYLTSDVLIISFTTKFHWKYPSKLIWISKGLDFLKEHYKEWNIKSIAIPPLGCSNGGLKFEYEVKPLIESKLSCLDIDVYICFDPEYAEGKEKEMLDNFNLSDKEALCDTLKIKGKARQGLMNELKIKRFYMIKELDNVGTTTYKKIYEYFYKNNNPISKKNEQLSLFDL